MVYWPACRTILMWGWSQISGLSHAAGQIVDCDVSERGFGQHPEGGLVHLEEHGLYSQVFMQLCCSIFLSTGHAIWPGRQPQRNCKEKYMIEYSHKLVDRSLLHGWQRALEKGDLCQSGPGQFTPKFLVTFDILCSKSCSSGNKMRIEGVGPGGNRVDGGDYNLSNNFAKLILT